MSKQLKTLKGDEFVSLVKQRKIPSDTSIENPHRVLDELSLSGPLLIQGKDAYRTQRLIDWLKDTIFRGEGVSYLGENFGAAASLKPLAQVLSQPSLFNPVQLVVIYHVDKVKAAAGKILVEILAKKSTAAVPVLTAQSFSNQKAAFLKDIKNLGTVIQIEDLTPQALKKWVEKEARRLGGSIAPEAAFVLSQQYGDDLTHLSNELQRLILLVPRGQIISRTLLDEQHQTQTEHSSFELMQEIARKNVKRATILSTQLVEQGFHPLQVSTFLSKAIRTLFAHHVNHQSGLQPLSGELANAWFWRQLSPLARNFLADDLVGALRELRRLDFELKSSSLAPALALTLSVQRMTSRNFAEEKRELRM